MPFPSTYKPKATFIHEALDILESGEGAPPTMVGRFVHHYLSQTQSRAAAIELAKRELAEATELK